MVRSRKNLISALCGSYFSCNRRFPLIFLAMVLLSVLFMYMWQGEETYQHVNYFDFNSNDSYIVMTPTCKIMNLTAWDPRYAVHFIPRRIPEKCSDRRWTYVNGSAVHINSTAMSEAGYPLGLVMCCYREITRVQSLEKHEVDKLIRFASDCIELKHERNEITAEFIQVRCQGKYPPLFLQMLYTNHHALPQLLKSSVSRDKVKRWNGRKQRPPNVIIIGIDSTSRLNFERNMGKTAKVLKKIGAIQMVGYTKSGENTFPNTVNFLSGHTVDDLSRICFNASQPQDDCPYLWKEFNSTGYLTAHLEDVHLLNIFNYYKLGFAKQQVDFYLRPLMIHLYGPHKYYLDCIGPDTVDEKILGYITELVKRSSYYHTPLFAFAWLTNVGHGDMNTPRFADHVYERFLEKVDLENSILFFMSDHGMRFDAFRATSLGWYEDRLPNFWVYLPSFVRQQQPEWYKNLKLNSRRLTSPFDLYQTLEHILMEYTNASLPSLSFSRDGVAIKRKYGQSIFHAVPVNRACDDAGIGDEYCVCNVPRRVAVDDFGLLRAVQAAISVLNNEKIPPQCARFKLRQVVEGASTYVPEESPSWWFYVGTFIVEPGQFVFEVTVRFNKSSNDYTVAKDVLRLDKISRSTWCINDAKHEQFCYCL